MKSKVLLTTLAALLLLPLGVNAEEEISYTYLDVAYVNNGMDASTTFMDVSEEVTVNLNDGDGIGVRGSYAFLPNWHAFAAYADTDTDLNLSTMTESLSLSGDVTDWSVGVGYNFLFNPKLSGFVQASWDARDVDFGSVTFQGTTESLDIDNDGLGANVGLRGIVTDWLELNGHVRYSEVGGVDLDADQENDVLDSNTLFGFGGEFHITDQFSLCAGFETGSDVNAWSVATRYNFRS